MKPNIIYILPDQLGANHLGCYGAEAVNTPNIDRFASRSILFEKAYTASPVCTPYRGALFTGRYPSTTGIVENGMRLPDGVGPTLADSLGEAGYLTAYLGKWHLSGDPQANRWVPPDRRGGFADFVGWESHHVDHRRGRIWRDDPASEDPRAQELPMPGHETDALTDLAVDKLTELASAERPFCLFVAYQAPHPPCSPPAEFEAMYRGSLSSAPNLPEPAPDYEKPGWSAQYSNEEFRRRYWGEVSHLDAAIGRLLESIESLGLLESSIVVFTSDHGELAGVHGRYGKFVMYEESVRVPLIVSMPVGGRPEEASPGGGLRVADLISTVDFYPTFANLAGAQSPENLPGVSHARRWRDFAEAGAASDGRHGVPSGAGPRSAAVFEYRDRGITDGRHKLIVSTPSSAPGDYSTARPRQLFDLETDAYELSDIAGLPETADIEHRLEAALAKWEEGL